MQAREAPDRLAQTNDRATRKDYATSEANVNAAADHTFRLGAHTRLPGMAASARGGLTRRESELQGRGPRSGPDGEHQFSIGASPLPLVPRASTVTAAHAIIAPEPVVRPGTRAPLCEQDSMALRVGGGRVRQENYVAAGRLMPQSSREITRQHLKEEEKARERREAAAAGRDRRVH